MRQLAILSVVMLSGCARADAPCDPLAAECEYVLARDTIAAPPPRSQDFAVPIDLPRGPGRVDLASHPDAQRFRSALRDGVSEGPNFAGRFVLVSWGCGTACKSFAIVDPQSGRVFMPDFGFSLEAEFSLSSELLVLDPPGAWDAPVAGSAQADYYRWDGGQLLRLDSLVWRPTRPRARRPAS